MRIEPCVFFDGRCDEAIEFYRGALGAEIPMLMRYGEAPADGGQVQVPLGPSFFARSFGMLADRFGVNWMVVAGSAPR